MRPTRKDPARRSWPTRKSGLHAGFGPALEHGDLGGGPGAVAGHGSVLEPLQDAGGVGADVTGGPQVEGEAHRLAVPVTEQRPDVRAEADRLAGGWQPDRQGRVRAGVLLLLGDWGPARPPVPGRYRRGCVTG